MPGIDVNRGNPLGWAVRNDHFDICELLLTVAEVDVTRATTAATKSKNKNIKALLKKKSQK